MNPRHVALLLCISLTFFAGCQGKKESAGYSASAQRSLSSPPPLFEGMGPHKRAVTTNSPEAQRYFDQGLTWAFAFNHDEAIRSFEYAAKLDPDCAMCWWGVALCNGPHINFPMVPPDRAKAAWYALQKAQATAGNATPVEQALINALAARYADPQPEDRSSLDQAYAKAMAEVWEKYPDDSDVGTLYAESMMDLRPWDLWTKDGRPQPGTETIIQVLNRVLVMDPENPGANHLYIHTIEPSLHPELANDAANRLRDMVPASSHLLHMPSHIDVLTGRWAMASIQNEKAIKADNAYRRLSPKQGIYSVYMAHNAHMLCFASTMEGRAEVALRAAEQVVDTVPKDFAREQAAFVDPYMGAKYDALKRFGRWDDILKEPAPPKYWPITTAMWRMNRAVAYAAKGKIKEAEKEQAAYREAVGKIPPDAVMAISPAHDVLDIGEHFINGELAYRKGDIDKAVSELREAIKLEDQLRYMEPPEWMQPVRHTLGAVLLDAGRYSEAEQVYREDLENWPENGWSLYGLSRCLRARGANAEAARVEQRFRKVWSRADTPIGSSCKCVPTT
ncbi:MAG: tetratricopeptide repeat protein [Phycisphaerae bacterium]|nr:tetratricopeptide repeat protein [Phycisphaerae bacterium]